ncbi:MAG: hypothetical protein E6G51_06350 [Actinobacteria bacterium]|nr:MAG: hypothetical protein E6G51_06350 [Actinomycetota bacterium]
MSGPVSSRSRDGCRNRARARLRRRRRPRDRRCRSRRCTSRNRQPGLSGGRLPTPPVSPSRLSAARAAATHSAEARRASPSHRSGPLRAGLLLP